MNDTGPYTIAGYVPISAELARTITEARSHSSPPALGPHRWDLPPGHRLLLELHGRPAGPYRRSTT